MALTAHAFLFTIALSNSSTKASRVLSMALSIITSVLTIRLFIGHMEREVAGRMWLADFEQTYLPEPLQVHVRVSLHPSLWVRSDTHNALQGWKYRKLVDRRKAGWLRPLFHLHAFALWRDGLVLMCGIAIAVLVIALARPEWLGTGAD